MVCKRVLPKILTLNCINYIYKSAKKVPHNAKKLKYSKGSAPFQIASTQTTHHLVAFLSFFEEEREGEQVISKI